MDNDNFNINSFDDNAGGSNRVELHVLGISYSQLQQGAYALILAENNGPLRLPVVVGGSEAQSIAIKLEGIIPPRPMTHDLFASLMHAYNLQLVDVFIYSFEDGIFSSELTLLNSEGLEVKLDARTSDAIAIAMRTGAPIYTTRAILEETGFTMEEADGGNSDADSEADDTKSMIADSPEAAGLRIKKLQEALAKAIENEEYEEAQRISAEIKRLESEDNPSADTPRNP